MTQKCVMECRAQNFKSSKYGRLRVTRTLMYAINPLKYSQFRNLIIKKNAYEYLCNGRVKKIHFATKNLRLKTI